MPRGFLVKRYPSPTKNGEAKSGEPNNLLIQPTQLTPQRIRRYSDEDRSDSSSDHDVPLENPVFKVQDLSLRSRAAFVRATPTTLVTIPVSDPSSPSPPLTDFAKDQEEPLALTTAKINHIPNGRSPTQKVFQSIRNSVLYIPRLEDALPTTPPPLKTKPFPSTPNTAPAALHFGGSTPKTNPPPKKRFADSNPPSTGNEPKPKPSKRHKAVRKLNFDEDKTSPVSGTFIRDIDDEDDLLISSHPSAVRKGDIDPSLNLVVVTEEAKAELAKIENRIGDYVCQLCKEHYQDAFGLAQHRCSRIVHVEYRCPECDKVFNCPANLASHRRWHKPRPPPNSKNNNNNSTSKATISATKIGQQQESVASKTTITEGYAVDLSDSESMRDSESPVVSTKPSSIFNNIAFERASVDLECHLCGKAFQAHSLLKKHVLTHLGSIENTAVEEDKNGNYYYSRLSVSPPPLTIDMDREDEEDSNSSHPLCGFNIDNEQRQQGRDTGTVSCKFCPATFSSPAAIIRHINKYHPNENRQLALLQMATVRPLST